jgi:hypothetical protein
LNLDAVDADTRVLIRQLLVLGRLFDARRGFPDRRFDALAQVLPLAFLSLEFGNGV